MGRDNLFFPDDVRAQERCGSRGMVELVGSDKLTQAR